MSDYDTGTVLHNALHDPLNGPFCTRIHVGGSLIKNQDFRISGKRTSNRKQLPLSLADIFTAVNIIKPHEQINDCRLTVSGRSYKCYFFAGGNRQYKVPNNLFSRLVRKFLEFQHILPVRTAHAGSFPEYSVLQVSDS